METISASQRLSAPINMFINVNTLCNLRCPYCYSDSGPDSHAEDFSTDELLSLADELGEIRVFSVNVLGGEPTLRKDLFEFLNRLRWHGIATEVVTNGTLLSQSMIAKFKKLGVSVSVSIDGGSELSNRVMRGKGTFEKAYQAVVKLAKAECLNGISMTVSRLNIDYVREFVETFHLVGAKSLDFNRLYPTERVRHNWDELFPLPSQNSMLARELIQLQKDFPTLKLGGSYMGWVRKYQGVNTACAGNGYWVCGAGIKACAIRPDGWVIPCNFMWDYKCGNIRERSFQEIWRDSSKFEYLSKLATVNYEQQQACTGCQHRESCRGGCHAAAMDTQGSFFQRDPICWEFNGKTRRDEDFLRSYEHVHVRENIGGILPVKLNRLENKTWRLCNH